MIPEIRQALLDWNPWFKGEFPENLVGIERAYNLAPYLTVPEIKIIEGARRVGKSTLMYQLIKTVLQSHKKVLYINFEDETLNRYSLSEIVYEYEEYETIDHLFIDEVQVCKEWVQFIRSAYDRKKFQQIWISGSNTSLIKEDYATLLTGRNLPIHVFPLSFKEFLFFKGLDLKKNTLFRDTIAKQLMLFDEYMEFGAFPAVVTRSALKREILLAYFDDFIYKDIVARHPVNAHKLKELAIYLATNATKSFSYRNIAKALNFHPTTVLDYFGYLQDAFLFKELYKYDHSLKRQMAHDKKVYCLDTGLAHCVSFRFSQDKGRILENIVFNALQVRAKEIYFHKNKYECDFIIKQELHIISAIQVCVSLEETETKKRELNGLLDAMQCYGLNEGLILTYNETNEEIVIHNDIQYKIIIMPVWRWLLKNDSPQLIN